MRGHVDSTKWNTPRGVAMRTFHSSKRKETSAVQTIVSKDNLRLAYWIDDFTDPWTQPETLVLLHAAMGNSRRWFAWMPRLARRFRVVRMDLRGHGASGMPPPDAAFALDQLVDDALRLIDHVGGAPVHLVGNSAGGYVAQKLAIHHGDRVRTLALYGAPPGLKHSHALNWLPRIREIGLRRFLAETIDERFDRDADPKLVQWFIEQAGSNDPAFIGKFVAHMCTHWFMDEVDRIACPTLIVAAGKEAIGQASAYGQMHQRIRNSTLVEYDTAAHNICDGYPDRCVDDLLAFLDRVRAA
jgi:pimeloyl-ACP methyl ester carboxylesterase